MILKGSQRGGAQALALHLLNTSDNDHVEVHSVNGFMADDVEGALQEIHAISRATKCRQFMFSLSLSPPRDALVSDQDFLDAIQQAMDKLGLAGQPHVVIFHEKNARRHCHVVISRIDTDVMKGINLPFFKDRLCQLSHELYLTHGWDMPKGHEDREQSDPLNYSLEEYQVAKRVKRDPKALKTLLQDCWAQSDSKASFIIALQEHGFALCRGNRRGFVALDAQGNVYSLSRWLGVKSKELKARLGNPDSLPSIGTAELHFLDQITPTKPQNTQQNTAQFDAKMAGLTRLKDQMVAQQRTERFQLRNKHQEQKLACIKELKHSRSGLTGLWNWVQGNRAQLIATHQAALDVLTENSQMEMLRLSKQQRDARRVLQDKIVALQSWRDAELGHSFAQVETQVQPPKPDPQELRIGKRVRENSEFILDVISDKKNLFTRADIVRALAKYIAKPQDRQLAIATVMDSENLVLVEDGGVPKYSTREMVELERHMLVVANGLAHNKAYGVSPNNLKTAIRTQNKALHKAVGANLSDEQSRAITHAVNRRQLSAVIGLAGAGKSTMLSAARDAWGKQGYRVVGAALSGKAADGLQNASGITSRTLASYELSWKNGRNLLQAGDVLVIDEAGMIGSRQMARFIDEVQKRRAKLVLVGDPDQLQPINAGTPFRDITDKIGYAQLEEIRRQKIAWQRQASHDLAKGRIAEAMAAYDAQGAVQVEATQDDAITALVEDYMADCELNGSETSRIALAHRRVDVQEINRRIRLARKSAGELSDGISYKTDSGELSFATGDRILFTRNDAQLVVKNGMLGTVQVTEAGKISVVLDSADDQKPPRHLTISLNRYNSISHGYATTIHKSQGATIDHAYVLNSRGLNQNLLYVAMTRHKYAVQVYQKEHPDCQDTHQQSRAISQSHAPEDIHDTDYSHEFSL